MPATFLTLLDWRRQVAALYAEVRRLYRADPAAAHACWQAGRNALFGQHPQSPLLLGRRAAFEALSVWPYDPAYAFVASLEPQPPQELSVALGDGPPTTLRRAGRVQLSNAQQHLGSLEVYWVDVYGGGLLLPFKDLGSGKSSYGGGRYLLDTAKSADLGSLETDSPSTAPLLLDFNFAYHPSCFYNPRWNCPLAPAHNTLGHEVKAGERL